MVDGSPHARVLLSRVNHVVLEGTGMAVVQGLLEEVHRWLSAQPDDQVNTDLVSFPMACVRLTADSLFPPGRLVRRPPRCPSHVV